MSTARIIGPGRAGRSLARALVARGWAAHLVGKDQPVADAARGTDVLVIATPDGRVREVAAAVRPDPSTVVLHLSGSLGVEVLAPHPRRAALHPLVPLPNPEIGARRLLSGVTFAVAGDPMAARLAETLGGRVVEVPDDDRVPYHAAACVAANHVVALLGQVGRIASSVGLDLEAFLPLARAAVEDVGRLGPAGALTGPAVRGDWATLDGHLDALPEDERPGYSAGVALALRLAGEREVTEPAPAASAPSGPAAPSRPAASAPPASAPPASTSSASAPWTPPASAPSASAPPAPALAESVG